MTTDVNNIKVDLVFSFLDYSTFKRLFSNFTEKMAEVMAESLNVDVTVLKDTTWSINQRLDHTENIEDHNQIDFYFTKQEIITLNILVSALKDNPAAFLFSVGEKEMQKMCVSVQEQLQSYLTWLTARKTDKVLLCHSV